MYQDYLITHEAIPRGKETRTRFIISKILYQTYVV